MDVAIQFPVEKKNSTQDGIISVHRWLEELCFRNKYYIIEMRIPFVTFKGSQEKGGQLSRKYLHENICLNFLYYNKWVWQKCKIILV